MNGAAIPRFDTTRTVPVTPEAMARLYQTARFTDATRAELQDLPIHVRVAFHGVAYNTVHERDENVYSCYGAVTLDSFIGNFYESALADFCS